jgi:hypothetical protein
MQPKPPDKLKIADQPDIPRRGAILVHPLAPLTPCERCFGPVIPNARLVANGDE